MSDQWYYHQNGVAIGPVSQAQLAAVAQAGEIGPADLVWREGLAEWMPVSALGLFEPAAPPLPMAPPPPPLPSAMPSSPKSVARPPRQQSSAIVWPVVIGGGIVALFAAAAIGWLANSLTQPNENSRQVAAAAPAPAATASEPPARSAAPPAPVTGSASTPVEENPQVAPPATKSPPPAIEPPPVTAPLTPPMPTPAAEPASPPRSTAPPQPAQPQVETLYQELDIRRAPKFSILGAVTVQDLGYQMLSELRVAPPTESGSRTVEQYVLATKLLKADDLSAEMFAQSLKALPGWWFKYTISKSGEIVEWEGGPPDGRRAERVEPPGGVGVLVTSVMDEDGWKEMAKLSFQAPDEATTANQPWVRQMSHDFGALGSWYGETKFQRKDTTDGLLRVDYTHDMVYTPPDKGKAVGGALPFTIADANFKAEVAEGSFYYDMQAKRVARVKERFFLRGQLQAELLGQQVAIEVEEDQYFTLRILNENPWTEP